MSKQKVVDAVAAALNCTKAEALKSVDAVAVAINTAVKAGDEVQLLPLGKFKLVHKSARTGRNPATGEQIQIPAKDVVTFKRSSKG
jgi:nucleoid DNA-binding protein